MNPVILLVDDDPVVLDMIEHTLKKEPGYCLLRANNARSGLEMAVERKPDLILSDYYMHGVDGFEFCRQVKRHPEIYDTLFVLLTSATEIKNKVQGLESGADDYITKPVAPEELRSKVRAMLRIKSLQDELKRGKESLAGLNRVLQESYDGMLALLSHMIGLRVPGAVNRGQRAAAMVRWLAPRLDVAGEDLRDLEVAAQLHEIGKTVLPDGLVRQDTARLTREEKDHLIQHPLLGQRLLEVVPQFTGVARLLRHQMENHDGTGYPDMLREREIPAGAQILRAINLLDDPAAGGGAKTLLEKARGTLLNPALTMLLQEYLMLEENPAWLEGKRQVGVEELQEGMVIAADLFTGSGIKLLPAGTRLTKLIVSRIHSLSLADPIINEIYIEK